MKKILAVLALFFLFTTAYAEVPITVTVDSTAVNFDAEPRIIGGRTMVPLRAIFEALGAEVEWNGETKTVTASNGMKTISMTIGKKEVTVGERYMIMDTAPIIAENRTLIPARYAAEVFDNTVEWDSQNRVVKISSANKPNAEYYRKYSGGGISFMYPEDWLLDESYQGTVFVDNQPTSYENLGLAMISVSSIELVNSTFADTLSARYDYLLNDCGYNITEYRKTLINGYASTVFKYIDADGDYVTSYFILSGKKAYYIDFITDTENQFNDIFSNVLSSVRLDG